VKDEEAGTSEHVEGSEPPDLARTTLRLLALGALIGASAKADELAQTLARRLAAARERQSHHLGKQSLFELLTDIVSRQAICTLRRFSPADCLLA